MRQCSNQSERKYLPASVPASGAAPGTQQAIGIVAHRLCRLIWMVLHRGVRYQEMGSIINLKARQQRAQKMIRELRSLGNRIDPATSPA